MPRCEMCGEWPECPWKTDPEVLCGEQHPKPITNADRIRAMSDEELAFWMATNVTCCSCPVDLDACRNFEISGELSCEEILLDWLKSPVEQEADNG